jgi:exo-1,4-beta-D-glucosaminidase
LLALAASSAALPAETVTRLHENWRIQSACTLHADGSAIAAPGFAVEGWLKTAVPSTVLAAQAADGVVPDPYDGDNLRKLPGVNYKLGQNFSNLPMPADSPYACGWWYCTEFTAPADWSVHYGGGRFVNLSVFNEAMDAVYAKPNSAADYERTAQTLEYDSERAMYEAYSRNKYDSTGVIQWMLNNAWPSMIWHLYDYYLDADAGYFATKKACEPLHIQYSYDDQTIDVVNSTYGPAPGLHASVNVHDVDWKLLYHAETTLDSAPDSVQRAFALPDNLSNGMARIFFIDLTLTDDAGKVVSHNFYWVPSTLTSFNWQKTDYTHTPALRHEDLTALTHLRPASVTAHTEIVSTAQGRELRVHLANSDAALAFQVNAAVRTAGDDLIAPVLWSDNWIELTPGESTTLTALLPPDAPASPVVHIAGWNIAAQTLTPAAAQ